MSEKANEVPKTLLESLESKVWSKVVKGWSYHASLVHKRKAERTGPMAQEAKQEASEKFGAHSAEEDSEPTQQRKI